MIQVELRSTNQRFGTEVLATLEVRDDGSHRIVGSRDALDLREPMLSFPGPRVLSFYDDPYRWARALPHNLTSPYLHAVIVHDTPRALRTSNHAAG
jgi:hypothetical protein